MQKFYVDNLISRFIKCLLWDTYIPIVDVWKPGKNIIEGFTYITNDKYIVVAKNDYIKGKTLGNGPQSSKDSTYFEIKEPFIEGKFYRGITTNFQATSPLYDPNTHYALGQYLRYVRDMHDIDLLPFYNCYCGENSNKIRIIVDSDGVEKIITTNQIQDNLITYIVPVKYNKQYTIYYSSMTPFKIRPAYYDGITVKDFRTTENNTIVTSTTVRSCSKKSPFIYDLPQISGKDIMTQNTSARLIEDYLVLLIQVPKNNNSNLVVLEGNYSDCNIINDLTPRLPNKYLGDGQSLTQSELNEILKPVSSLLTNYSNEEYAFSDRLIEYLLYSPITSSARIKDNIKRVQEYLSSSKAWEIFGRQYNLTKNKSKVDIWDNNLRTYIYNIVTKDKKTPLTYDINGFVDKDSEFIIDKAKINIYDKNDVGGDTYNV